MSGSKWDSQPRSASRGRHDYPAADALPLQCAAIRAEFAAQPRTWCAWKQSTNEGEHNHAELKNRMDGSHV